MIDGMSNSVMNRNNSNSNNADAGTGVDVNSVSDVGVGRTPTGKIRVKHSEADLEAKRKRRADKAASHAAASQLVELAKVQGLSLLGPDGLLKQLTKNVLEIALDEEMTEHLGYEKHDVTGKSLLEGMNSDDEGDEEIFSGSKKISGQENTGQNTVSPAGTKLTTGTGTGTGNNVRNGVRSKTVLKFHIFFGLSLFRPHPTWREVIL